MAKKEPEKKIRWHRTYTPAYILFMAIVIASLFSGKLSSGGILIVASIASSAVILTNKQMHHLTTLGTITFAYIIAGAAAMPIAYIFRIGSVPIEVQAFTMLAAIGYMLYWLNLFHTPAIAFAEAFLIYERGIGPYLAIMAAAIIAFTAIRLTIYIVHDHLTLRNFAKEIVKEDNAIIKRGKKRIIQI